MDSVTATYLDTWNTTDSAARRVALEEFWSPQAVYSDPLVEARGLDELDAAIAAVHQQFPGFVFTPIGDTDAHHDHARFRWGLGPVGERPLVEGFDVLSLDDAGRILTVVGFLDKVPS